MCGGANVFSGIDNVIKEAPGVLGDFTKMSLPTQVGGTGEIEANTQKGVKEMLPGLSIMALPFAAAGGAALAGGEAGASTGAVAGGAEAGGSTAASGSLFGPGAADALDASLIGPEAGAAAGSGSAFAPDAAAVSGSAGSETVTGDAGNDTTPTGGTAFVDASTPTNTLTPETAELLGINGGFDSANVGSQGLTDGVSLAPSGSANFGESPSLVDSTPADIPGSGSADGGMFDGASEMLKKIGLSPASAGLLGLSAVQGLSKPKIPQAGRTLQDQATPAAQSANATIQSGGTASPAWATQKSSIDASIDEQIKQQIQQMLQQAQNSGQGADSQVTQQQINKLKNQLEAQRQTLYAQAQQQNVQAALQQLGISNQALSSVASQQFQSSDQAKRAAAQTAQTALMLQSLSNKGGSGNASLVNQGNQNSA